MGNTASMITKAITVGDIDLDVKEWDIANRHTVYSRITDIITHDKYICTLLDSESFKKKSCITDDIICIHKRLGTDSMEGEVYLVEIEKHLAVMKIMPVIDFNSNAKNNNEIKIATDASKLVLEGKCDSFPIVYAVALCNSANFSEKSKFFAPSKRYAIVNYITENLNVSNKKRFLIEYKSGKYNSNTDLAKYAISKNIEIPKELYAQTHVMLSELAYSDLYIYLKECKNIDTEIWLIIKDVFYAIKNMHLLLGVVHNDLHLGNILVLKMDKIKCLIHDFGKSEYRLTSTWTLSDKIIDYEVFLSKLLDSIILPKIIRAKIKKCLIYITQTIDNSDTVEEEIIRYANTNF